MSNWEIAYVLPNLKLHKSFETPFIAIVPSNDERVVSICKALPNANMLVNCFINSSNHKVEPSILLINSEVPESVWSNEAIVSFRNIVALSIMFKGWADVSPDGTPFNPLFSNTFDFYPMTLGRNGGLIYTTPAVNSYYSIDTKLVAMPNNYVPQNGYFLSTYDEIIYNQLIKVWHQRFIKPGYNNFNNRKIFRSIEIAYHALSVPIKNQTTIFDIGVNVSLWISAFEILTHPKSGNVNSKTVIEFLGKFNYNDKRLNYKRYTIKIKRDKTRVNLTQKLYNELYCNRNDFMHGNKVSFRNLFTFKKQNLQQLWTYAPIIYRTALIVFLDTCYAPKKVKKLLSGESFLNLIIESSFEKRLLDLLQNNE